MRSMLWLYHQRQDNHSKLEENAVHSPLYKTLVDELEYHIPFFRWTDPDVAREQLDLLHELKPSSDVAKYYEATFKVYAEGALGEALDLLSSMKNKGSSAKSLEDMINREIGRARATA